MHKLESLDLLKLSNDKGEKVWYNTVDVTAL